jgi:hypothetical protein
MPAMFAFDASELASKGAQLGKAWSQSIRMRGGIGCPELFWDVWGIMAESYLKEKLAEGVDLSKYRTAALVAPLAINLSDEGRLFLRKRRDAKKAPQRPGPAPVKDEAPSQASPTPANGESKAPQTEDPYQAMTVHGWPST